MQGPGFSVEQSDARGLKVRLHGDWTFRQASAIEQSLGSLPQPDAHDIEFHCDDPQSVDLTGVWLLYSKSLELAAQGYESRFIGFNDVHLDFLQQVVDRPGTATTDEVAREPALIRPLIGLGRVAVEFVSDLGRMAMMTAGGVRKPSPLTFRETVNQLFDVGLKAIPIIALMSFLVGVVIGYQASTQLARLGAAAFTIDLVAVSILREMGVMLTAVMVAGRSGSAFAAALGVMKLNDEIDAMQIMDLGVNGTLVLPRVLGLVIALPLLTALSDAAGIAGAWVVSVTVLDISTTEFVTRLRDAVDLDTVMVGISKAPVFALLIGAVATLRGLQVTASAEELGRLTTRAVVEAIFLVIAADAIFSIIYTEIDF